jgi:hypothetical protein
MAAGFGWIDFSEEQRDRVNSVINMLSAGGTVDELGIGTIRDSLADWMFPGVSTIQTRPKYFIIITEIFLNYLSKHFKNEKVPKLETYLTNEENRIMHLLAKNYGYKGGEGVIGVNVARDNGELARKASFIYWNGIRIHGLIDTQLSRNEYAAAFDLISKDNDDNEDDVLDNFDHEIKIKAPKFDIIHQEMNMDLTKSQADFLRDQFKDTQHIDKHENNLLTEIIKDKNREEIIINAANFNEAAEVLLTVSDLPIKTKAIIQMALDFDLLTHGAHIRYNMLLHKKAGSLSFDDNWNNWLEELEESKTNLETFDFNIVFSEIATRVDARTKRFLKSWQEEVLKTPIDYEVLDKMVYRQEINKKGAKAKLTLKDGEYNTWVGVNRLGYRFNIVKNIINDLQVSHA